MGDQLDHGSVAVWFQKGGVILGGATPPEVPTSRSPERSGQRETGGA